MPGFGAVAGSPDVFDVSPHEPIGADAFAFAQAHAGGAGQVGVGVHPHAENDDVGRQGPSSGHHPLDPAARRFERRQLLFEVQLDAVIAHRIGDQGAHVRVEGVHDLRGALHQRHLDAAHQQGLGRFQADVAAADDHRALRLPAVHRPAQHQAALQGGQPVDAGGIGPRQLGADRRGTGGDQQMVVRLPELPSPLDVPHPDPGSAAVDLAHLVADAGVDAVLLAEHFRRPRHQAVGVVDHLAQVVGQTAGRIRGVRAALENDDLHLRPLTANLGSGAHPGGVAADHDQALFAHFAPSPCPSLVSVHCRGFTTNPCHRAAPSTARERRAGRY